MSIATKGEKIDNTKRSRWKSLVAGICGNLSLFIFHPLENVKTRLQANDGLRNNHLPRYNGVIDTFLTMWRKEGLIAFYRGLYINILANALSGGIFFGLYADGKKRYNYDRETSSIWLTSFISLRAGLITMVCANPVW